MTSLATDPRGGTRTVVVSDRGRALTILRISKGWNQAHLAAAAGTHASAISDYERGKKAPELETLVRIVNGMGMRLEEYAEALEFVRRRDAGVLEAEPNSLGKLGDATDAHQLATEMARATYRCWFALLTGKPAHPGPANGKDPLAASPQARPVSPEVVDDGR